MIQNTSAKHSDSPDNMRLQISESLMIGILLSLTGGFLDAYSYIIRGNVFANAQTGNIVLLGVELAESRYKEAFGYLIPIIAFAAGIFIAEAIKLRCKKILGIYWKQIVLLIEIIVLFCIIFIPPNLNTAANIMISFVCALQVESFRTIKGNAMATTMCTGNLRTATELLFIYRRNKNNETKSKSILYFLINFVFVIGAVIGTLLTRIYLEKAVGFCCLILLAAFLVMFSSKKNSSL